MEAADREKRCGSPRSMRKTACGAGPRSISSRSTRKARKSVSSTAGRRSSIAIRPWSCSRSRPATPSTSRCGPPFARRGYGVYRLLPGGPVLVPDQPGEPIDGFELNLFAAKSDRAAALAREGLSGRVRAGLDSRCTRARDKALDRLRRASFCAAFAAAFHAATSRSIRSIATVSPAMPPGVRREVPWPERCAALSFACRTLVAACQCGALACPLVEPRPRRWEAGQRALCVGAAEAFGKLVVQWRHGRQRAVLAGRARFDGIVSRRDSGPSGCWLSAFEQFERVPPSPRTFGQIDFDLDWLCAQPFVSAEMERRRVLQHAERG